MPFGLRAMQSVLSWTLRANLRRRSWLRFTICRLSTKMAPVSLIIMINDCWIGNFSLLHDSFCQYLSGFSFKGSLRLELGNEFNCHAIVRRVNLRSFVSFRYCLISIVLLRLHYGSLFDYQRPSSVEHVLDIYFPFLSPSDF